MTRHQLSFGTIDILQANIAEVIIDEGVEMTLSMVNDYHQFLKTHLQSPFALLINKVNPYSYTYEAQKVIATLTEIAVMAVVTYRDVTQAATEHLIQVPRDVAWNIQLFSDRSLALAWLMEQVKTVERQDCAS